MSGSLAVGKGPGLDSKVHFFDSVFLYHENHSGRKKKEEKNLLYTSFDYPRVFSGILQIKGINITLYLFYINIMVFIVCFSSTKLYFFSSTGLLKVNLQCLTCLHN